MKWISFVYIVVYALPLNCVRVSSYCPPRHCHCTQFTWSCAIEIGHDQISCGSLPNLSQQISVNLELVNWNNNWTTFVFVNVYNCHIKRLKISTKIVPSNSLIGNLKDLEYLIIQNKPVDHSNYFNNHLYHLLSGLDKLKKMKIESLLIPDWFQDILMSCHSVEEIELKYLKMKDIESNSFINCKRLAKLTIRFNSIPNLFTAVFHGLLNLAYLTLSSNEIMKINKNHDGWWVVRNLKDLDLSDNFLSNLEAKQFIGLSKLDQLILTNNNIQFIDARAFEGLDSLKNLNLKGNKKLILFDLSTLNPMVTSLTMLAIDVQIIQCINGKSKLFQFHNQVQDVLNLRRDCNGLSQTMLTDLASSTITSSIDGTIKPASFPLMIALSVFITMFISVIVFFVFYYCSTKKKSRNYTNSTTGEMTTHSGSSKLYFQDSQLSPLNNTIESQTGHATTHSCGTKHLIPRYNSDPILMS